MSTGLSLARILDIVGGICIVVFGLLLIALPGGAGSIVGIWTVLGGLALIIGALIERIRYRSEATDREGTPAGPGGEAPKPAQATAHPEAPAAAGGPEAAEAARVETRPGQAVADA